jgi:hypothetical protein
MDEDNIIDEQSASRHTPHGRSFVAASPTPAAAPEENPVPGPRGCGETSTPFTAKQLFDSLDDWSRPVLRACEVTDPHLQNGPPPPD